MLSHIYMRLYIKHKFQKEAMKMAPKKAKRRNKVSYQYLLRMRTALRERVAKAAKANERSFNGEITERLEASFREDDVRPLVPLMPRILKALKGRESEIQEVVAAWRGMNETLGRVADALGIDRDTGEEIAKEKSAAPADA
jgi:hypothetical protein